MVHTQLPSKFLELPEELLLRIFNHFDSLDASDLVLWSNKLERKPFLINEGQLTESLKCGQGPPPVGLQVDYKKHAETINTLYNLSLVSIKIHRIVDHLLYRTFYGHLTNDLDTFILAILRRPERAHYLRNLIIDQFPLDQGLCGCVAEWVETREYSREQARHELEKPLNTIYKHSASSLEYRGYLETIMQTIAAPFSKKRDRRRFRKYVRNGVRFADTEAMYTLLLLMCPRLQSVSFCYTSTEEPLQGVFSCHSSTDEPLEPVLSTALKLRLPTVKDVSIDLQNWVGNDGLRLEAREEPWQSYGIPICFDNVKTSQMTSLTISTGPRAHGASLDLDLRQSFKHKLSNLRRFRCVGVTLLERDWMVMLPRMPNLEELELDLAIDYMQGRKYFEPLPGLLTEHTPHLRVLKIDHRGNADWREQCSTGYATSSGGRVQHIGSLRGLTRLEEVTFNHNVLFDDHAWVAGGRSHVLDRLPEGLKKLTILSERLARLRDHDDVADVQALLDRHSGLEEICFESCGKIPDDLRHPDWTRAVAIPSHVCDEREADCHRAGSDGVNKCLQVWALLRRACADGGDIPLLLLGKDRKIQVDRAFDAWQTYWRGGPNNWNEPDNWVHAPRVWP